MHCPNSTDSDPAGVTGAITLASGEVLREGDDYERTSGAKAVLTDEQWRAAEASGNPFLRCGCGATWPCGEHYARRLNVGAPAMHPDCTAPDCDCEPGIECAARGASLGAKGGA